MHSDFRTPYKANTVSYRFLYRSVIVTPKYLCKYFSSQGSIFKGKYLVSQSLHTRQILEVRLKVYKSQILPYKVIGSFR